LKERFDLLTTTVHALSTRLERVEQSRSRVLPSSSGDQVLAQLAKVEPQLAQGVEIKDRDMDKVVLIATTVAKLPSSPVTIDSSPIATECVKVITVLKKDEESDGQDQGDLEAVEGEVEVCVCEVPDECVPREDGTLVTAFSVSMKKATPFSHELLEKVLPRCDSMDLISGRIAVSLPFVSLICVSRPPAKPPPNVFLWVIAQPI